MSPQLRVVTEQLYSVVLVVFRMRSSQKDCTSGYHGFNGLLSMTSGHVHAELDHRLEVKVSLCCWLDGFERHQLVCRKCVFISQPFVCKVILPPPNIWREESKQYPLRFSLNFGQTKTKNIKMSGLCVIRLSRSQPSKTQKRDTIFP